MRIGSDYKIEIVNVDGYITVTKYIKVNGSDEWQLYDGTELEDICFTRTVLHECFRSEHKNFTKRLKEKQNGKHSSE